MTLTEFLLARLDEDQALAQASYDAATDFRILGPPVAEFHINNWKPARVLAEVDAKRHIASAHEATDLTSDNYCIQDGDPFPCWELRLLASIYADHPDYRKEWRP